MNVEDMLVVAEGRYDKETDKIGRAIREELLIPFCDKHRLTFDAGMGCWFAGRTVSR